MEQKELLDLELSFEEINSLPLLKYIILPINADIEKYKLEIENKIKFPCWIKLNSGEHKTKLDAVKSCINFEELEKNYKKLKKQFPEKKFVIQENIKGIEVITGIKQDKTFGKVLLIGAGGTYTEILEDFSFLICPVTEEEIFSCIQKLKIYKIIQNLQLKKLIKTIKNFSELEIIEADLNPIILNEKDVKVVDARISI